MYYMSDNEIETFIETHIPLDYNADDTVLCCCNPTEPHNELMKFRFIYQDESVKNIRIFDRRPDGEFLDIDQDRNKNIKIPAVHDKKMIFGRNM